MSTMKSQKQTIVKDIQDKIKASRGFMFFEYHGLNVEELNGLRRKLKASQSEIKVYKNTLLKKALEKTEFKDLISNDLRGPVACAFGYQDISSVAKTLVEFKNRAENELVFKSGILEAKKISAQDIKKIATLPAREELLSKCVGTLAAPIQSLLGVLSAVPRDFIFTLNAVYQKKQQG
ncbi:MAG: 50S ribosomal protein L10 [Deltaproteobacteria bacterium]|nr:50S ribosomal protein L10 [Deltaproteobacteria bacterium]